jgi:hypothetical protein
MSDNITFRPTVFASITRAEYRGNTIFKGSVYYFISLDKTRYATLEDAIISLDKTRYATLEDAISAIDYWLDRK